MRRGVVLGLLLALAIRLAGRRFWLFWRYAEPVGEMRGRTYWA